MLLLLSAGVVMFDTWCVKNTEALWCGTVRAEQVSHIELVNRYTDIVCAYIFCWSQLRGITWNHTHHTPSFPLCMPVLCMKLQILTCQFLSNHQAAHRDEKTCYNTC